MNDISTFPPKVVDFLSNNNLIPNSENKNSEKGNPKTPLKLNQGPKGEIDEQNIIRLRYGKMDPDHSYKPQFTLKEISTYLSIPLRRVIYLHDRYWKNHDSKHKKEEKNMPELVSFAIC